MAERGKKRVPDEIKKFRGTFNVSKANKKRPTNTIIAGKIEPPSLLLNDIAQHEWDRMSAELIRSGVLQETDVMMLAAYCNEIGSYWVLEQKILELGEPTTENSHKFKIYASNADRKIKNAMRIASNFGLTPADRQKIIANPPSEEKDLLDDIM